MSDTPKTDARERIVLGGVGGDWKVVLSDFARQLERELAAAKTCIAMLEDELNQNQQELRTVERFNIANIRALGMIYDAAGITRDADILEWISGTKERIASLEEAGDECARYSTTQASDDWHAAKEAKP